MGRTAGGSSRGGETSKTTREERLLDLYTRLISGESISADEFAQKYGVSGRTITRTVELIQNFVADYNLEKNEGFEIVNETEARNERASYRMVNAETRYLSRAEIIAISKILLDSRGLNEEEMDRIIEKLITSSVMPKDREFIEDILKNEWFNYSEPTHSLPLLDILLDLSKAVSSHRIVRVQYERSDGSTRERILEPLGIIFSEYYFYLAANIQNIDREKHFIIRGDENPTIYRLDRIKELEILSESFRVPEKRRFREGEYRKRIQFMFGGEINRIKLLVKEFSFETVTDHLPDFKSIRNTEYTQGDDGTYDYIFSGELFGDGIVFFLLTQGDGVKLVEPEGLRQKLREKTEKLASLYCSGKE